MTVPMNRRFALAVIPVFGGDRTHSPVELGCAPMSVSSLKTTAPSVLTTDSRGPMPMLALVITWCAAEPWRTGELAFFPIDVTRLMGRGGDPIDDYSTFGPQRPGDPFPAHLGIAGCLRGDGISRLQATATSSGVDIVIDNVGKCPMFVNGREVVEQIIDGKKIKRAHIRPDDTVMFAGNISFVCVLRLPELPVLRYTRVEHAFGRPDVGGNVGEGPIIWAARDNAVRLGMGFDFVLILGETGAGKTGLARLIHHFSTRAKGPFKRHNASKFTETLLESQLFGKLANFPTPGPGVEGLLPSADGGTLFLDEIGILSLLAQRHLLTCLDDGGYTRLGESKERTLDVRFIGATNLERGALQGDFQYRLPEDLRIAPLRERKEDIALLAREMVCRRVAKSSDLMRLCMQGPDGELYPRFSGRLIDFLVRHELAGNTRELNNLLAAAIGYSHGSRIEMFPEGAVLPSYRPASSAPVSEAPATEKDEEEAEVGPILTKDTVLAALVSAKWNKSRAAKDLKINRNKLLRVAREMGIDDPAE